MNAVQAGALFGLAVLLAMPAAAQERPRTLPSRDVDITYRITRAGQTLQERTRWLAAQSLQRIDPPGEGMYMLMDHRTHHAAMIDDAHRTVLDLSAAAAPGPLDQDSTTRFVRVAESIVANLACTDWQSDIGGGGDNVLCITADGALLRVQTGGRVLVEALSVAYGPADLTAFKVPSGYQHVAPKPR